MFDFTPLLQQLAHNDGALDVVGLAVAIQYSGLAGIHFKADFGFCVGHGLGVLGGQSSRIYFDMAVAEVANVEVFAHAGAFSSSGNISSMETSPLVKSRTERMRSTGTPFVRHCDTALAERLRCAARFLVRPTSLSSHSFSFMAMSLA